MRPEEIDYSDTRKHYFDISNGEVLAGQDERKRYLEAGAQAMRVVNLGALLRDPTPHLDPHETEYERLDTSSWPTERYTAFARWLHRVVDPPQSPRSKQVTKETFHHARLLGVGPGAWAIRREFGNHTALYKEAKLTNAHSTGYFDDWDVDTAVAYIKSIGGKGPPTLEDIDRHSQMNPKNPSAILLWDHFRDIGGVNRLVELAGYPVIKLWNREDYIDWGVRFMRANDGQEPTARMANYLSSKHRGPTASTIINHFDFMSSFQAEVIPRYYEYKRETEEHDQAQLQKIEDDLQTGAVPLELFSPFPHITGADSDDEQRAELNEELESLYADRTAAAVVEQLGARETIVRYAKFKVLEEVAPQLETDTKISISRDALKRNFLAAVKKSRQIPDGDIEYAALVEGFFDYIWPDDDQVETLKLDKDYHKYISRLQAKDTRSRKKKSTTAA